MIATKREKYIVIGTGVAIAALVFNSFVINPYFDTRQSIQTQNAAFQQQLTDNRNTMLAKTIYAKKWTEIKAGGLKTDQAAADSQLQHALLDWAQLAGVSPQTLKADLPRKEGSFLVIGYRMTATGTMRSVSRLIWALETATIPVRVSDVRINPQREHTDDLSVQIGVSTLCSAPDGTSGGQSPRPAARPSTTPVRPAPGRPTPSLTRPATIPARPSAQAEPGDLQPLAFVH